MSVTIIQELPNLYVITLSGLYTNDDLKTIEKTGGEIPESGKVNVLICARQFTGWSKDGDWDDLTFLCKGDPYVGKIAVVIHEKWREQMLMFLGAGHRKAEVKVFPPNEEEFARLWLGAGVLPIA